MGYTLASGSEPYLPDYITPRYAQYVSVTLGLFREVVVLTRQQFIAPPQLVTASSVNYRLSTLNGEHWMGVPAGNIRTIAGPQGQKGDTGPAGAVATNTYATAYPTADVGMTLASTWYVAASLTLAAGTYLIIGQIGFINGAGAGNAFIALMNAANTTFFLQGPSHYMATANKTLIGMVTGIVTFGSSTTVHLNGQANVTGFSIDGSANEIDSISKLTAVKIA